MPSKEEDHHALLPTPSSRHNYEEAYHSPARSDSSGRGNKYSSSSSYSSPSSRGKRGRFSGDYHSNSFHPSHHAPYTPPQPHIPSYHHHNSRGGSSRYSNYPPPRDNSYSKRFHSYDSKYPYEKSRPAPPARTSGYNQPYNKKYYDDKHYSSSRSYHHDDSYNNNSNNNIEDNNNEYDYNKHQEKHHHHHHHHHTSSKSSHHERSASAAFTVEELQRKYDKYSRKLKDLEEKKQLVDELMTIEKQLQSHEK
jgi:hypothetical protein